jgi:CheY-like chemotaxis protein
MLSESPHQGVALAPQLEGRRQLEESLMPTILLVDNDRNTLTLYRRELTDEGYEVATAVDGREALERFKADRPDLVVLDVRMPEMDGLEVLARMLSIDRHVPVILFSAYSFYQDNFLSWSADAFISKSSDLSTLKSAIRESLLRRGPAMAASSSVMVGPDGLIPQRSAIWW